MAFFFLFVWLVPLVFFIAGSVSSQALPQVGGGRVGGEEEDGGERKGKGKKGSNWSLSTVKRWVMREKAEVKDSARAGDSFNNGVVGDEYSRRTKAAYEEGGGEGEGQAQPPWYPAAVGSTSVAPPLGAGSSEGEWLGGQQPQPPTRPVYMRQRAHIS